MSNPIISPRVLATGAPPIPAARAWAAAYDGRAGAEIDLTQAVPGYPPHPEMLERLAAAAGTRAAVICVLLTSWVCLAAIAAARKREPVMLRSFAIGKTVPGWGQTRANRKVKPL
jgi:hypothetical protein